MHLLKSISKEIFQEVFGFWTLKIYTEDGNIMCTHLCVGTTAMNSGLCVKLIVF